MKIVLVILLMLVAAIVSFAQSFTVGSGTSSTSFTSPAVHLATDSVFTYYGFAVTNYASAPSGTLFSTGISSAAAVAKFPPIQVSFSLTGTNMEMLLDARDYPASTPLAAYFELSDGYTTTVYTDSPSTIAGQTPKYITVLFATNTTHDIMLSLKGGLRSISVTNGNTLATKLLTPKPNLLIVQGDSYTEGYNPNFTFNGYQCYWFDGWVYRLAKTVPNTIPVQLGVSGTGFSNGSGTGIDYLSRVADVINIYSNAVASGKYGRIFITASGTINDLSQSTNTVFANATNFYTQVINACPTAHVFSVGNWLGVGGRTSAQADDLGLDVALSNATASVSIPWFSPIQAEIRTAGNYNTFFPSGTTDSIHPSAAGYEIMATWVNTNLTYTFGSTWSAGGVRSKIRARSATP